MHGIGEAMKTMFVVVFLSCGVVSLPKCERYTTNLLKLALTVV